MKVALVSSYCLDSTMPLARHLAEENIEIQLFAIMPKYNQNFYVVDFSKNKQKSGFVNNDILIKQMGNNLCQYLSSIKTKFFVYPAGAGKKNFFQDIYYAWKFSRHLIKNNFDVVHLIHTANRFSILLFYFLKGQKIIQTLHEVTDHSGDTTSYNIWIMKILIRNNIPVIFNSQISKDRFLSYRASITNSKFDVDLYKMIRFGLYETYRNFFSGDSNRQNKNDAIPIILHFGRIVPYKGIDILSDAVKIVQLTHPVHLIVAGKGDSYFNLEGIKSYEFLNYAISNEEIIDLVKKCTMVVCPYRSVSQSGIPMTVFLFNKPIIASNIGGFREIIEHNKTGILVDKVDACSFANAIECLISNNELQESIAFNIDKNFKYGEFSWPNIAKETVKFYNYQLSNHY